MLSDLVNLLFPSTCFGCKKLGEILCPTCREMLRPHERNEFEYLSTVACAGNYSGWLRSAVLGVKEGDVRAMPALVKAVATAWQILPVANRPAAIVPIPSTTEKIRVRGSDTILKLSQGLQRELRNLGQPETSVNPILKLNRVVQDQVGLDATMRQLNLQDAFSAISAISGPVVILDDVVTTGSTLNAAAKALTIAGAQKVFGISICG